MHTYVRLSWYAIFHRDRYRNLWSSKTRIKTKGKYEWGNYGKMERKWPLRPSAPKALQCDTPTDTMLSSLTAPFKASPGSPTWRYGKLHKFPVSQILYSNICLIQFYLDNDWILILKKLILNQFLHFKLYKVRFSINSKIS